MTRHIAIASSSLLFVGLAGCAIHPAPRNVTGLDTSGIVDRIKCEAAFAIENKAIQKLEATGDVSAVRLAEELRANRGNFVKFKPKTLVDDREKKFYDRYIDAAIAFDFTLTSLEDNSAATEVDFARVVTNGAVSVPLSASSDAMRNSAQTFTITESFRSLLDKSPTCPPDAESPNFVYPISGTIGIYNVISTFIDLNEDVTLTPRSGQTNIYSDALTFTTTVTAGAVPHLVLSPPTRAFHLTGATLTAAAMRKDTDMVSIGLSLPVKANGKTKSQATKDNAAFAINAQRDIVFKNSVIQFFTTR